MPFPSPRGATPGVLPLLTVLPKPNRGMLPQDFYLRMQTGALCCVNRFSQIGSQERGKNLDTIERHSLAISNPWEIYEPYLMKVQKWRECSQMAWAVTLLGHAMHQADDELFDAALLLLKEFETESETDLLALSRSEPIASDPPGAFRQQEFAARLEDAPLVELDVLQGATNLIKQVSKPFSVIESLAIYHRVRELFESQGEASSKHRLLLGYAAFYDILDIERCFARDQQRPVDLLAMSARLLCVFKHLKQGQSAIYPDIHFDYVNGQSLQVDFYADYTHGYIPAVRLKYDPEHKDPDPSSSPKVLLSYVIGILRGAEYLAAVDARAHELVNGADLPIGDHRDPKYAVDIPAAIRVLNHPALSGNDVERSLNGYLPIEKGALNPDIYSRPFSFDVSVQTPLQQVLEVGLINEYGRLIPPSPFPPAGNDAWAYILFNLVENQANNGLRIAAKTIDDYQTNYPERNLLSHLAENEGNCFALVQKLLSELSQHPKSLHNLQALSPLILLAARQTMSSSMAEAIERFRPTLPFDEIVTSLQALHEFYADTIPEVTRRYFGEGFQLPGGPLKKAVRFLQRELDKLQWVDSKKVRLRILPSHSRLDGFHPHMGDRNCLMVNPNYVRYSLTDPRFLPHRILVEGEAPENAWQGGIFHITTVINGKKSMLLCGLDPRLGLKVNPAEFLDGLEKGFGEIAREGGYDQILIHTFEGSSRKGTIQREIDARYGQNNNVLVIAEEDAIGFPFRVPYSEGHPKPGEKSRFHIPLRKFYVMRDLS